MHSIVVCGIPRSGSTLVGQIVSSLFPEETVLKTHPTWVDWTPDPSEFIITTVRDPRDVASSLYRVRMSRSGSTAGGKNGMAHVIQRTQTHFMALMTLLMRQDLNISELKYEDFAHDHDVIFDLISEIFLTRISKETRKRLSEKFSIEANRKRASKLKDFNEVDDRAIHGDHVGPVEPGSYRTTLPEWGVEMIDRECSRLVKVWGYAN